MDGWTALGDPVRRAILERLAERPRAVGELAGELPISRPAVSQHLKVLKDARLVIDRKHGTRRVYQVDPEGLEEMRGYLDRFWAEALAGFKTTLEQQMEEERTMNSQAMNQATNKEAPRTLVRHTITVEAPIARAFEVFTDGFGRFKPREHNLLKVEIAETVFEPRVGGHIYDRGVDGSECRWARILAFEPPNRVVFSWDISPHWQVETDPAKTSEVEVRFVAETAGRTRVELEHRHLDRHGADWESVRDGVAADQGWPLYLDRYAGLFTAA